MSDIPRKRYKFSETEKVDIKNLKELIAFAKTYKFHRNIDTVSLWNILGDLEKLDEMIGMEKLKESIFQQLIYYIQGMHKRDTVGEYLHMRIVGPPGTGKTTIANIIANIYVQLGILKGRKNTDEPAVKLVHREDFIAGYLGQTGIQTKKLLESCLGGVMLYDEGYSMGSNRDDDSFAKEAVDSITSFLSEHKTDFCFIIVGYEEDIEKYFFSMNKGLSRRIPWYHKIDAYSPEDIALIALKMINDAHWEYDSFAYGTMVDIIKNNPDLFKHAGGAIENFINKTKIVHANRVFSLSKDKKFRLTEEDFRATILKIREELPKKEDGNYMNMYL